MTSNQDYIVNSSDSTGKKGNTTMKKVLCTQATGVVFFALGLVAGILIGYFAMNPGRNEPCVATAVFQNNQRGNTAAPPTTVTSHATVASPTTRQTTPEARESVPQCPPQSLPTRSFLSRDRGIFEPMTKEEMNEVTGFMRSKGIITTTFGVPSLRDNYIYTMALFPPNKSEALAYMDRGGPHPGRYAYVHVHRGNRIQPDLMEYKVGPLGEVKRSWAMYNKGELHYNSRPRDYIEHILLRDQVVRAMAILRPLLQESFDGAHFPDGGLEWYPQAPPGLMANERETRFTMLLTADGLGRGRDLNPLPLTATVHNPGIDTGTWYTHSFYYLNQGPFSTAEELLSAYRNDTVKKFSLPSGFRQRIFSTSFPKANSESRRPFSKRTPPRSYNPSGQRFTIHDHTVKWMGWEFTIGTNHFRGISIHNAKFKGQRIIYENSLNDVALVYSADASSHANTIYLDASYGLGWFADMIPGVDCPEHATYLEATHFGHWAQVPVVSEKAICVFESAGEESLWRRVDSYRSGLPNHYLVVRTALVLGNYDYTFDFKFFLDGSSKTEASASGIILAAFWDPDSVNAGSDKETDPFGYRIGPFTHGALHDHTFGYKVDLDIGGTNNSFELIHWKSGPVEEAIRSQTNTTTRPVYFLYNETRYVTWETLMKEAGLKIDMVNPKFWTVVNENVKNAWGVKKGYRIIPETTLAQVLTDAHPAMQAISYTKYHCAVTKQKDNERYLTDKYGTHRLAEPLVSLEDYINDEPIRNEDIVTWLSVGFMHLPTAEDMPMTLGGRTGFLLKPFNYFDSTPTFDVPHYLDTPDHSLTDRLPPLHPCVEEVKDTCYFCD